VKEVPELADVERRVLAHLPRGGRTEEAEIALIHEIKRYSEKGRRLTSRKPAEENEVMGGSGTLITSYTGPEMLERLCQDDHRPSPATQIVAEGGRAAEADSR